MSAGPSTEPGPGQGAPARSSERASRLVALTLFGAASIVPALLARGALDAKGLQADARALAGSLSPLSVAGGLGTEESQAPPLPVKRLETALLAPASPASTNPVRFFSKHEIDQATATAPRPGAGAVLLPPTGLEARWTEQGVLLTWTDNAANPSGLHLRTQVYRWRGAERPAAVATADHRYLDGETCPGTRVSYALLTVQLDRLEGVEIRRSVLGETVTVEVPVLFDVEPRRFDEEDGGRARAELLDRRREPAVRLEVACEVGRDVGHAAGIATGWTLEAVERETREETVAVSAPVFGPDGSRVVENGAPAFRSRNEARSVLYPILRLRDRCGAERIVRAASGAPRDDSR